VRLSEWGEFGMIDRIAALAACDDPDVLQSIGDDCALIRVGSSAVWAVTTDAAVSDRHFRTDWMSPYQIGARAMAAALSDIAAMGARPRFAFTSLALPVDADASAATELVRGLVTKALAHGACLLGGDPISRDPGLVIEIAVHGECGQHLGFGWGARPGDLLLLTGTVGDSAAALHARSAGVAEPSTWARYADPTPRLPEAAALAPLGLISTALDVSDGVAQDAGRIAERSSVAVRIIANRLPISEATTETADLLGQDPLLWALTGGEDFELLFTAPAEAVPALQAATTTPITVIGEIREGQGVEIIDGQGRPMQLGTPGWDHFAASTPTD